ncbi:MAG: VOC family protein [Polyangiaceae bacterium]|nr:VOC family protein [Polyangiaceae bacterium]
MPLSVHHLAVVVSDLNRSEAFYSGLLGLPVIKRHVDTQGAPRSVWVQMGANAFLAIERAEASGPTRADNAPGHHCVAFSIPASERTTFAERLQKAGFPIARETDYTLYTIDPDGNLVAFSHYPTAAEHPPKKAMPGSAR